MQDLKGCKAQEEAICRVVRPMAPQCLEGETVNYKVLRRLLLRSIQWRAPKAGSPSLLPEGAALQGSKDALSSDADGLWEEHLKGVNVRINDNAFSAGDCISTAKVRTVTRSSDRKRKRRRRLKEKIWPDESGSEERGPSRWKLVGQLESDASWRKTNCTERQELETELCWFGNPVGELNYIQPTRGTTRSRDLSTLANTKMVKHTEIYN